MAKTISITIKFLSALRDDVGVGHEALSLPQGSTLRTVAAHLAEKYGLTVPSENVIATLNGRGWQQTAEGLDTLLTDGDVIHLFPPIAGG